MVVCSYCIMGVYIPESLNSSQFSLETRDCVLDKLRGMEEVFAGSELLQLLRYRLHFLTAFVHM